METQWHFRKKHRGDDIADPIGGEFFADGSLGKNPAMALVREALQNALDAGEGVQRGDDPVHVRIGVHRGENALSASASRRWFSSLAPHLQAENNGLRDAPTMDEPCDHLVIEDFGTSGLTGDISSDNADGEPNNFVDFLRSDGRTRKSGGDRGSWGVGKNVFPRSSRINGFIAYTIREDDRLALVMGKSILKIRRVDGEQYQPPGYFGASWEKDQVPRPYEDPTVAEALRGDFHATREGEPGLSLVIPWADGEIGYEDILTAVVEQFYFAILAGGLSVTLAEGDEEITLHDGNIIEYVRTRLEDHAPMVELAAWSLRIGDSDRLHLNAPPADQRQQWTQELVPDGVRSAITEKLRRRERVAVRVPLHVHPKAAPAPEPTFFDVFLEHNERDRSIRPSFFREQLLISNVKRAVGVPKVRPLVVIEDKPLALLLRAAEPPNHTDWDLKTSNFKNAYREGNHVITFVKTAVKQLMGFVRAGEEEPDPNIAIDFFALPEPDERPAPPGGKRKKKTGNDTDQDFDPPPRKPRRFTVEAQEGGFALRPGEPGTTPPKRLNLAMAYDVLSGSPWKQYERADFDLTRKDRSGVQIVTNNDAEYEIIDANHLRVRLISEQFLLFVSGFDPNRDLIVRAYDPKEPPDADQTAELHEPQEAHA